MVINKDIVKENEKYTWLSFLISPFFTFLIAIRNFKQKSLRKFLVLIGGLYGLYFVPIPDSDATRYQIYYRDHSNYTFSEYLFDIFNMGSSENTFPDVYAYTMFYIGHLFSSNPQFFHMLTALVYFYVFVKLIGGVFDYDSYVLKKYSGVFFLGIVFLMPFSSGINGVRWPLGLMVFLLGTFNLLTKNKIKFLFLAALSIFIHFSLYPAVIALIMYYFLPFLQKTNYVVLFALFALVAGSLFSTLLFSNLAVFSEVAENKLQDYTGDGYIEYRENSQANWNFYVGFARYGTYIFSCVTLLIMWLKQKYLHTNVITKSLFCFAVLMSAISFLANGVVDLSTNRYTLIVSFFTLVYLVYLGVLNHKSKIIKLLMYLYAPILILNILLMIRVEWQTLGIELLVSQVLVFFISLI